MSAPLWSTFLLPHVAAELCGSRSRAHGRAWRMEAVTLFVDLSGFTAMAEALARLGPDGAEILTNALNALFASLIAEISSRGGQVAKFAGDAMTVLFPAQDLASAASAALAAACAVQAHLREHAAVETEVGRFPLAVKAGIGSGAILVLVGGDEQRLEVLVTGPAIDQCAEAEHHAERGEIVLHGSVCAALPGLSLEPREDGFYLLAQRPAQELLGGRITAPMPEGDHREGLRFVHPVVASRAAHGQERFIGEHRQVVILFARLPDLDLSDSAAVARGLDLLERVIRALSRWGGTLDKVDCGDKGTKIIAMFGAPLSREGDAERAVACALDLVSSLSASVGLHAGTAFCGLIGSPVRREYTAIGDTVNLAARLMQAAKGELIASEQVFAPLAWRYLATALPPMRVKGKAEPVLAYRVEGIRTARFGQGHFGRPREPIVGRLQERAAISSALAAAGSGRGSALVLLGEHGTGKSRLGEEAAEEALSIGFCAHGAAADDLAAPSPWQLLRDLFGSILEIEGIDVERKLAAALAEVGEAAKLPYVLPVFGLPPRDIEGMLPSEAARRLAVETALVALLERAARERPRLLIVDDAHRLDESSLQALAALARRSCESRVLILVLARALPKGALPERNHVSSCLLAPLSAHEIVEIARMQLGQELSAEVASGIVERAEGNPLYAIEIARFLRRNAAQSLSPGVFPASLQALVSSRLDALSESDRLRIKAASVSGLVVSADAVGGYFPEGGGPEEITGALERAQQAQLLDRASERQGSFLFLHRVVHKVAYEGMALSTREELHGRLVSYLSARPENDLHDIAYHAERSGSRALMREWFARVAVSDEASWANHSAASWWERLLPIVPSDDRDLVLAHIGRCRWREGKWALAEAALAEALQIAAAQGDAATSRLLEGQLAELASARGLFPQAMEHLSRAHALAVSLKDEISALRAASGMAQTLYLSGQTDAAEQLARTVEADAIRLSASDVIASMLLLRGTCAQARDPNQTAELQAALSIAGRLRNPLLAARAAGNLGIAHQRAGRLAQARALHELNRSLALSCGDVRSASIALGNLGVVLHAAGDARSALACVAAHLAIFLDIDDRRGLSFALGNLASGLLTTRRLALARRALDRALSLMRALSLRPLVAAYLTVDARLRERQGDLPGALQSIREAVSSGEPLATDASSQLLLLRLSVLSGGVSPKDAERAALSVERSAFAAWCASPREAALYQEAVREISAMLASFGSAARPPSLPARLLDLDLVEQSEQLPLPPDVDPDPDLDLLLDKIDRIAIFTSP